MSMYPSFGKQLSKARNRGGKNITNIIFGRVKDISITPDVNTGEKSNWKYNKNGEWDYNLTGYILFTPIGKKTPVDIDNLNSAYIAAPLLTNVSKLPVINEIVAIFPAPSLNMNKGNPASVRNYYMSIVSVWNNANHNAFPDLQTLTSKTKHDSGNNSSVEAGIPNNPFDSPEELKFGNYFEENPDIRALLPSEGDVIVEGRFGNSIRLGSSAPTQIPRNQWSDEGDNGKPVVIIRNGQKEAISPNPWDPIFEDVNNDGSSIYMLSDQPLRAFDPAYSKLDSLNLNLVNAVDTSQEIQSNIENLVGLGGNFDGESNPGNDVEYLGQVATSSLDLDNQEELLSQVKQAYSDNNFKYETDKWKLNITGVRTPGKQVTNKFDDNIVITFKDENDIEQVYQFPITTQPGKTWVKKPMRGTPGVAILKPGQYPNAYKFGRHAPSGRGYEAIVDDEDLIVFRDNNKDLNYDDPNIPTQTGEFGINIHRSNPRGTSKNVNNWSAGCQVFANSEDFKVFMELCTKSYKQQSIKKGKIRFTYTLIEA